MDSASSLRPSPLAITIVTAGTLITGALAYAAYFDHRRRTDPNFRKALRKEYKELAKQQKAESKSQHEKVKRLVAQINAEGFPTGNDEEVEAYFLRYLSQADQAQTSTNPEDNYEAAGCFFRALKVYPRKAELINLIDSQVKKDVRDILAMMISFDDTIAAELSRAP